MDAPPHLNWSSTYDLLPPASLASKLPPGDKIILPQSALEQLLAASSSAQSHDADHTSPYSSILYGPGFAGHDTQQLPHPLMFRLLNPGNGKAVGFRCGPRR
ncbi:hypothetical protein XA68_12113 [Ophiocordyceps unilateralis]|uniref:Uncharacterized protein n=1 Tax=Ophiocordyceps unilateralis TaxID=268505 RepID=A0A2A9PFI6_OPHUN|nr:hypothetical protein XA68_12113 [Ophiocordyceps unilateralis]